MDIVSNEKVNFNSLEENIYKNMMKLGRKTKRNEIELKIAVIHEGKRTKIHKRL